MASKRRGREEIGVPLTAADSRLLVTEDIDAVDPALEFVKQLPAFDFTPVPRNLTDKHLQGLLFVVELLMLLM